MPPKNWGQKRGKRPKKGHIPPPISDSLVPTEPLFPDPWRMLNLVCWCVWASNENITFQTVRESATGCRHKLEGHGMVSLNSGGALDIYSVWARCLFQHLNWINLAKKAIPGQKLPVGIIGQEKRQVHSVCTFHWVNLPGIDLSQSSKQQQVRSLCKLIYFMWWLPYQVDQLHNNLMHK